MIFKHTPHILNCVNTTEGLLRSGYGNDKHAWGGAAVHHDNGSRGFYAASESII